MSLSVCLVTRNEEDKMERVLRSVAGVADEIIVAETGSTDRTAQVAAELGARVCPMTWDDDFAAARNHALAQARGDWILWVNPDEELLPISREQVAALLGREDVLLYVCRVRQVTRSDQPEGGMETMEPRLFRHHPELRYLGRLHPHLVPPLDQLARAENKKYFACDLTLRRLAYLSVVNEPKLRWAVRLLEKELKDRPGQLHYLIEYGRNLLNLNDPKGHAVLAEATQQILAHRNDPQPPTPTVGSLLEYLLMVSPQQSRSRILPGEARELALRWFPNTPPLLWLLAHQAFERDDFREAAGLLERLVQLGRSGTYDRWAAFQPQIIGGTALMNLGMCYVRLRDLGRAELCFAQLVNDPEHRVKASQFYADIQRLKSQPPQPPARPPSDPFSGDLGI
jgi:hypothetical protein